MKGANETMLEGIIFLKCLTPDKASSQICSMSLQLFSLLFLFWDSVWNSIIQNARGWDQTSLMVSKWNT